MKIAIVQDELVQLGGGEQVTLSFHHAFPEAPIYTLSYNAEKTFPEFKQSKVITSLFGKLIKDHKNLQRFFFPFGIWAMKMLHLKNYDVVLMSTTHCAKYVKVSPGTLVVTYCHTPFRLAWSPESYESVEKATGIQKRVYQIIINQLKKIDKKAAEKTDWFIANSSEVLPRIEAAYHPKNPVTIINPPVRLNAFKPRPATEPDRGYYLIVSRFEPYKKVDLVIEAFNGMSDKKLVVVGKGSMETALHKLAAGNSNISFRKGVSAQQLADLYSYAKGFIFPQLEDYGLTPLEAIASGTPVIAYGKGGVTDTMVPYDGTNEGSATAIFFERQEKKDLIDAIQRFEKLKLQVPSLLQRAAQFSEANFIVAIQRFINEKI